MTQPANTDSSDAVHARVPMPAVAGLPSVAVLPAASELSAELAELLQPRIARLGYLGGFFAVAARQPDALAGFIRFTEALKRAVPDDLGEVVALRVATRLGNAYEQAQHEALARTQGHSEAWLAAVTEFGSAAASSELTTDQHLVLNLSDAVLADAGHGAGDVVAVATGRFGADTTVALVLLISRFVAHAHVANAVGLVDPLSASTSGQPPVLGAPSPLTSASPIEELS